MPDTISLLPEEMRKKEEALRNTEPKKPATDHSDLRFSIPKDETEDIEVIEIDEGDVDQVLANESPLTKLLYRVTSFFDEAKAKLFQSGSKELPPKLPPQFLTATPPKAKPVVPGAPAGAASPSSVLSETRSDKPKARIIPSANVPKRVRIIKRIRKPVRVSFVSDEDLRVLHIDVSRRRFTFITMVLAFTIVLGGGAFALLQLQASASEELASAQRQLAEVKGSIQEKQKAWSAFQDLEPRLKALIGLLDQHVSPTHLLEQIERNTIPTVYYNSFSLTPDGQVSLGVITDSYESAAKQIVAFQRSGFIKKVEGAGYAATYATESSVFPSSVTFSLTLTLADSAMRPVVTQNAP